MLHLTIDLCSWRAIVNGRYLFLKIGREGGLECKVKVLWKYTCGEGESLTSDRRSRKVTFGVALDSTVLARTTVPSPSSTPSATLFFTMICFTGCMR